MLDSAAVYLTTLNWEQRTVLALSVLILMCLASLAAVTLVVVRLPPRYFCEDHSSAPAERRPILRWVGLMAKNSLGVLLILLGLLLSLPGIPGQGILTILIGVMLVNFPGKRRLERKLVARARVLSAINHLRAFFGKPPLLLDDGCAPVGSGTTGDKR